MSHPETEAYLAALPPDQRAALERLRAQVLRAAPRAEAHFGYGLPGFTYNGHPFLYLGAAKKHCALYGSNDERIVAKLGGFKHSKGAIQFTPEKPLPATLVKEIVKTRIAASEAKWGPIGATLPPKKARAAGTGSPKKATKAAAVAQKKPRTIAAATPRKRAAATQANVDAFVENLAHPHKKTIEAVRTALREAGPRLTERIKWNAPSLHLDGVDFSAFQLRAQGFVQLILLFPHGIVGEAPGGKAALLEGAWPDRRFVRFVDEADVQKKKRALTKIVRAWVENETRHA
jgi:uncharacterized protein YdhG (YjbR/CyaY superfamily)